jgi:hypothetical protein
MNMTYADALAKVGATVPSHLIADAEVPILTGPQAQGDLLVVPIGSTDAELIPVPDEGVQVVFGEATGNSHFLHRGFDSPGVTYARGDADSLLLAVVHVPAGQNAQLVHTDEHGSAGIGEGTYAIHGKRELRDEITRVQD